MSYWHLYAPAGPSLTASYCLVLIITHCSLSLLEVLVDNLIIGIWAASHKKGPWWKWLFSFFLKVHFCEIMSIIAIKISFLWVVNMVYMMQRHEQQVSRHDNYVMTCKTLLLLFCIWTTYVLLIDYKVLKFYADLMRFHDITNFLNQKSFSSKLVLFTEKIWCHFSIMSQLR